MEGRAVVCSPTERRCNESEVGQPFLATRCAFGHVEQGSFDQGWMRGGGSHREIRSTGFNGFPRGIADSLERLEHRELKYPLICHAEENAIMHAARIGVALKGCIAYVTWPPCTRCARSLVQAGVVEVVYPADLEIPDRWRDDFDISSCLFREAGVQVRTAAIATHL